MTCTLLLSLQFAAVRGNIDTVDTVAVTEKRDIVISSVIDCAAKLAYSTVSRNSAEHLGGLSLCGRHHVRRMGSFEMIHLK